CRSACAEAVSSHRSDWEARRSISRISFLRLARSKMTSQLDQPDAQIARFAADIFEHGLTSFLGTTVRAVRLFASRGGGRAIRAISLFQYTAAPWRCQANPPLV